MKEFQELPQKILNAEGYLKVEYLGQQGYLKFALDNPEMFTRKRAQNKLANANKPTDQVDNILMQKTFLNVSSVLDDEVFARLGWQQFQGSASEFQELIGKILNVNGSLKEEYFGQPGYFKFAGQADNIHDKSCGFRGFYYGKNFMEQDLIGKSFECGAL